MFSLWLVIYFQKSFLPTFTFWEVLPFGLTYVIANIIGEFFPYVYHKIIHVGKHNSYLSQFLWKIHAIHHLPKSMNWFKTNWVHPINMFFNTFLKMTPILFLGFSKEIIFLVGVTHVVIAYISHANIKTHKSFLDYIIVTPRIHHFHHSVKIEEAKNFGNIVPFWDIVFGTFYNRKGTVENVGVFENENTNYSKIKSYFIQLFFPLTFTKQCCSKKTFL